MLCVHRSRWLKDVKEKIIKAIDHIDHQQERCWNSWIFFFTQNFDRNIPHISQGTWPHKKGIIHQTKPKSMGINHDKGF